MFNIGMIFDNQVAFNAAFYMHAWSSTDGGKETTVIVNSGLRTIQDENLRYSYILIKDDDDMMRIGGMEFDAIFSEVVDPNRKQYIMSRFRPRFDK